MTTRDIYLLWLMKVMAGEVVTTVRLSQKDFFVLMLLNPDQGITAAVTSFGLGSNVTRAKKYLQYMQALGLIEIRDVLETEQRAEARVGKPTKAYLLGADVQREFERFCLEVSTASTVD